MSSSSSSVTAATSNSAAVVPKCQIDENVLNKDTISDMDDIALSFFASACGKNRGAFVLDPPDGQTYGCLHFPENVTDMLGIEELPEGVTIPDANSIKDQFLDGNITSTDTLKLLNFMVDRVYHSTPSVSSNRYGCDVNGLARLSCGDGNSNNKNSPSTSRTPRDDGQPIRSVNLIGLLIPNEQPWATGTSTTPIEYTTNDYQEMIDMGLNTVQISVPTSTFNPDDPKGVELMSKLDSTLSEIAGTTGSTGVGSLKVILSLVSTGDELDFVVSASAYSKLHKSIILGMTSPKGMTIDTKTIVDSIRAEVGPKLPIFLPYTAGDLLSATVPDVAKNIDDPNVYGSVSWSHINTVGDIASSTSQEDRSKMFYHESVACTMRSPFEHNNCFGSKIPIFWSSGFDLSIDDCAMKDLPNFNDYGQCDRFDETIGSGWWDRHRSSFAARQLYASEIGGLGWSYSSWKLQPSSSTDSKGIIDHPSQLLSLKDVNDAGLFPILTNDAGLFPILTNNTSSSIPAATTSCLNPPENDFILGDDTLAPTMSPPPDCGNGWWNYTTSKCDYWVPPPEPTMSPTEPCPVCEECSSSSSSSSQQKWDVGTNQSTKGELIMAGFGGAAAVLILGAIHKYFIAKPNNNKHEYSQIP